MGTATVKWIDGKQFIGIDSTQHSVVLSTPGEEKSGSSLQIYCSWPWLPAPLWMWSRSWKRNA